MVGVETEAAHAQIQRMFLSKTFETSEAQRRLLQYLAEKALSGEADRLKEYTVGIEAFGKPSSYDPQEDSIVRTQTGRLRGKLREYYTTEGKDDPIVVELPKGGFKLVFRAPETLKTVASPTEVSIVSQPRVLNPDALALLTDPGSVSRPSRPGLPWILCAALLAISVFFGYSSWTLRQTNRTFPRAEVPWPLSRVVNARQATIIVSEDANLPKLRNIYGKAFTLEQYLSKDFPLAFLPSPATPREGQLMRLLATKPPPGNATLQTVRTILELSPLMASRIAVRTPREVQPRDLRDANFVLIGSSISNPWASVFEHFLNFREIDQMVERGEKFYSNLSPLPGEQSRYQGVHIGDENGATYADFALVPNEQRNGSVMLLAGLQSEGTEAAGLLLSREGPRRQLLEALRKLGGTPEQDWFEALIRTNSVGGTPGQIDIVAVRRIP